MIIVYRALKILPFIDQKLSQVSNSFYTFAFTLFIICMASRRRSIVEQICHQLSFLMHKKACKRTDFDRKNK